MPADFLSDGERRQHQRIPAGLSPEDLLRYCLLPPTDYQLVAGQRRDVNRLGFALQLIIIRLMNHLPQEWYRQVPAGLIAYVAKQLSIAPAVFVGYGEREATLSEHLHLILHYLKRRRWQPIVDTGPLERWLLERALEHDNERVLLRMACEWLQGEEYSTACYHRTRALSGFAGRISSPGNLPAALVATDPNLERGT